MNGLYMATSGMIADGQWLQVIGDNLTNANSPGYLAQDVTLGEFPAATAYRTGAFPAVLGQVAEAVVANPSVVSAPLGYAPTAGSLDFAINGAGFFAVRTPNGVAYTRDGHFFRDANGTLVDQAGDPVLNAAGSPIVLPPGPITVGGHGVLSENGAPVAALDLVDLSGQLTPLAGNLYQGTAAPDATSTVVGGALNTSGASVSRDAALMIEAESSYQSLTTMASTEAVRLQTTAQLALWA